MPASTAGIAAMRLPVTAFFCPMHALSSQLTRPPPRQGQPAPRAKRETERRDRVLSLVLAGRRLGLRAVEGGMRLASRCGPAVGSLEPPAAGQQTRPPGGVGSRLPGAVPPHARAARPRDRYAYLDLPLGEVGGARGAGIPD